VTNPTAVGTVASLWRFPVKSMGGERLEEVELTRTGIIGDRAYALLDVRTDRVVSAKSVKHFPGLLDCQAAFVESPQVGQEPPPVVITLATGTTVRSDAREVDQVLSAYFQREVVLARAAPEDYTIDQYHPDIEDVDPAGHRDTVIAQKLGSAFFAEAGLPSPVPVGAFFDLFPVSVVTTATLTQLSELQPASHFDERRFRMNLTIATQATGFVENGWVGGALTVGEGGRLRVAMPDPRCVMTTLPQAELPNDGDVLRTLVRHNRVQIGDGGRFPCAGVYAVVETPGAVRAGDRVTVG
jgi:uncharacterized protein